MERTRVLLVPSGLSPRDADEKLMLTGPAHLVRSCHQHADWVMKATRCVITGLPCRTEQVLCPLVHRACGALDP